jgi:hypothetical protein
MTLLGEQQLEVALGPGVVPPTVDEIAALLRAASALLSEEEFQDVVRALGHFVAPLSYAPFDERAARDPDLHRASESARRAVRAIKAAIAAAAAGGTVSELAQIATCVHAHLSSLQERPPLPRAG